MVLLLHEATAFEGDHTLYHILKLEAVLWAHPREDSKLFTLGRQEVNSTSLL